MSAAPWKWLNQTIEGGCDTLFIFRKSSINLK